MPVVDNVETGCIKIGGMSIVLCLRSRSDMYLCFTYVFYVLGEFRSQQPLEDHGLLLFVVRGYDSRVSRPHAQCFGAELSLIKLYVKGFSHVFMTIILTISPSLCG